jgi:hypothetical protein
MSGAFRHAPKQGRTSRENHRRQQKQPRHDCREHLGRCDQKQKSAEEATHSRNQEHCLQAQRAIGSNIAAKPPGTSKVSRERRECRSRVRQDWRNAGPNQSWKGQERAAARDSIQCSGSKSCYDKREIDQYEVPSFS